MKMKVQRFKQRHEALGIAADAGATERNKPAGAVRQKWGTRDVEESGLLHRSRGDWPAL
jgi:hypothetical protein